MMSEQMVTSQLMACIVHSLRKKKEREREECNCKSVFMNLQLENITVACVVCGKTVGECEEGKFAVKQDQASDTRSC